MSKISLQYVETRISGAISRNYGDRIEGQMIGKDLSTKNKLGPRDPRHHYVHQKLERRRYIPPWNLGDADASRNEAVRWPWPLTKGLVSTSKVLFPIMAKHLCTLQIFTSYN